MESHGEHAAEGHREADLRTAPGDNLPSHLAQPAQGELDADGKEQQDDANFRQALDLVHVRHQAECVGAEQDARDDEPREGGELDTVEHQDDEQGDGEDDRQVFEDVVFAHGGSRYVIASGPVGVGGDAGHTSRVKTIMESRVAGCKVVARISSSITPEHPGGSLDVGTSRFRLLRQDDAVRDAELSRTEAQLRATARQQEAVAHIGQRALAGAPPDELIAGAVAIVARVLEVPFASVLELRPESRTLLLRAGVGWRDGAVGRTVLPTDADSHAGFVLRSTGPVVVEDLATDARFGSAPLLTAEGVVSSLSVLVHGKGRPFVILGVHTAQPREFTIHDTHFLQAVANVLATAIDRARAEEALRRSEEHFRSLIENGSDIVTIVGENGVFRYASPSVERVLGYAPRDLLERNAFDYVHPDDIPVVAEALAGAIRHPGVPQAAQFRFRARDGVWRVLEAVGQARVGPGDAAQLIVNARDVTDRRRQERALRENKERLRTVIAGAPLVLFALDRDAVFTMVEGRGLDAVGVRPALLIGRSAFEMFAELPQALADVRRALTGEMFSSTVEVFDVEDGVEGEEVMWKRRDGEEILVRLSGRAVRRSDGTIDCFETIAEDVTERRALEEQLRQSQKMEAIGQLTGGIAHDFNNLLTIILANAQLIAKALPTERGDAHADLRDVMSAALRGRVMVQELLGFARRSSLDLQSADLGGLVADLSGFLRRILPADVEVVIAGSTGLPEARADVHATEQILFNLATNARDAMPNGGVLRIETARATLTA